MAKVDFTLTPAIIERFWSKVARCPHGPTCAKCCWLWQAGLTPNGYGLISLKDHSYSVHRLAYIITYGAIFPGLYVCHRCDVKHCVNPQHLFLGTPSDNVRDAMAKGRQRFPIADKWAQRYAEHLATLHRGEQVVNARLTEADVREIRRAHKQGEMHKTIAARFGVSPATIGCVIRRVTWKHVRDDDLS